jgi:hypothetical protein
MRGEHCLLPNWAGQRATKNLRVKNSIDGDVFHWVREPTAGITHPNGCRDIWGVTSKPNCGAVIGSASFSSSWAAQCHSRAGAASDRTINNAF